jgi:hypothetical protein
LRTRCFAAVCRARWYAGNGRLAGFFLTSTPDDLDPFASWLEAAAADLWAVSHHIFPRADQSGVNAAAPPPTREGSPAERFLELKRESPQEYQYWLTWTRTLLESLPLGLAPERLTQYMKLEYGLDLGASAITFARNFVEDRVAYELKGFMEDDTLDVLANRTDVEYRDSVEALAQQDHIETTQAYVRNQLLSGDRQRKVWRFLEQKGVPADRIEGLLLRRALSLGGRVTDESYCAQVRRQEIEYAMDEVVKAVIYELASAKYPVIAVAGPDFVLEVPRHDHDAAQVATIARRAQQPYLGDLSAPLACVCCDEW